MSVTIDKDSHFFISINKQGTHSFIMLGVYDQNEVEHVLCRVGKFADISIDEKEDCDSPINIACSTLFSNVPAKLADEGITRPSKASKHITYQAYDIKYKHYLQFVKILESLQTQDNKYKCYKPIKKKNNESKVTLELTDKLVFSSTHPKKIKNNVFELRIGNTCRHTAIDLVEQILHAPVSSMISDNFLTNLPYETLLEFGQPSKCLPFYVLPIPPSSIYKLDETKLKIITKLYSRMEHMLLINTHSKATQNKFLKLKNLYLQIIGPQKDISLEELLQMIQTWKNENSTLLGSLRQTYIWDSFFKRKSATLSLVEEVEHNITQGLLLKHR